MSSSLYKQNWYDSYLKNENSGYRTNVGILAALAMLMMGYDKHRAAEQAQVSTQEIEQALLDPILVEQATELATATDPKNISPTKTPEQVEQAEQATQAKQYKAPSINQIVDQSFLNDLIRLEGSISYQKAKGMFRNNKFYPYKDVDGQSIGYGHFILPNENYSNGIYEEQALQLLEQDARKSAQYSLNILNGYNVIPEAYKIVAQMTFQLGKGKTLEFKKMLAALRKHDYKKAASEMLDSDWAKQTPARAQELANKMQQIK